MYSDFERELWNYIEKIATILDVPTAINHGYRNYVTRDMASDAGDMRLEGEPIDYDDWEQIDPREVTEDIIEKIKDLINKK